MIGALEELSKYTDAVLWHGLSVFLRVGAFISLLPAFGEQSVPVRVKLSFALAFTVLTAPAVPNMDMAQDLSTFLWLSVTEVLVGLILGIGVRLFILALQTAGSIAAQSTSLAQILGGAVAEPVPAMGQILVMGGLALAVTTGLHVRAAELVIFSYQIFPMGELPAASGTADWGVLQISRAFSLAFTLAAPFVLLSVLYNIALGVINKAMPQLMVAFVGAPVITAGGLLLLCLSAPLMLETWLRALNSFMANPMAQIP